MTPDAPDPIAVPPVVRPPAASAVTLTYRTPDALQIPDGWTHIDHFQLDPALLPSFVRSFILLSAGQSLFLSLLTAGFILGFATSLELPYRLFACAFLVIVSLIGRTVRILRQLSKTRRLWPLYRLVVANEGILQVRPGFPNVQFAPAEVRHIREAWDAFWVIKTNGIRVIIPKRVHNLPLLRERLAAIQPITRHRFSTPVRFAANLSGVLANMALMLYACYGTNQPSTIALCLILMIALSIPLALQAIRIANFSLWQRIANIGAFSLLLLIVTVRLAFVLLVHP